ncbi:MAG TPA: BamA/TamA family outer membrane protein [Vicinamibacterales bacterium]|nr:BamA/TamA family outer membrane protein [Vicinamibacterales bacterium]
MILLAPLVLLALAVAPAHAGQPVEIVESVVVHGNHTTPTEDVLALVGPVTGQPATEALFVEIRDRLDRSGRFAGVDVRRRYLSIDDPTRVLVVIVVDEHEGISEDDLTPGPWKRFSASSMWLPVLQYQEGYGFTYGARLSFMDRLGPRSRISVPLTWGGERQAQLELERTFDGPVARVVGGGGVFRRENPFYEVGDLRQTVWGRVETAPRSWLRAGAGGRFSQVGFGELDEPLSTIGADIVLDTRRDPALPRNAVYGLFGVERVGFDTSALGAPVDDNRGLSATRLTFDGRGYVGLFRQIVLAVRAQSVTAADPLPPFEKALLGGIPSLRGWDVGSAVGDNLAAASAEVLMPLTSPLQQFARFGVKLFADTGAVYDAGQAMGDQRFEWGYGAGVFLNATVFSFGLDLGWREGRGTPNAHVQLGVRLSR